MPAPIQRAWEKGLNSWHVKNKYLAHCLSPTKKRGLLVTFSESLLGLLELLRHLEKINVKPEKEYRNKGQVLLVLWKGTENKQTCSSPVSDSLDGD